MGTGVRRGASTSYRVPHGERTRSARSPRVSPAKTTRIQYLLDHAHDTTAALCDLLVVTRRCLSQRGRSESPGSVGR
eukprot:13606756-Alexandrium_andersonii.AAC.1